MRPVRILEYSTDHPCSRGTSTYDGIAIASAVLHHLATHTLALSCFATHYSMLTEDYRHHPNIRTMHMATAFDDDHRAVRTILNRFSLSS
jgi:DNA mismatch repair ATPase MutS